VLEIENLTFGITHIQRCGGATHKTRISQIYRNVAQRPHSSKTFEKMTVTRVAKIEAPSMSDSSVIFMA
jgi:hypothetical protein